MITVFTKSSNKIQQVHHLDLSEESDFENIIWIDMHQPTDAERTRVEKVMEVCLQTPQQAEEIESSSRYFETDTLVIANSNFLVHSNGSFIPQAVSFILKDHILISLRNSDLKSFSDTVKKIETYPRAYITGYHIFVTLFETRIDLDADIVEHIVKDISHISKRITLDKELNEKMILEITKFQENTMSIRENIMDKQRVVSGILKSERFPHEVYPKLRVMIKDIGSLLEHTSFSFERLEYLQDSFIGLINIEQNKIIKIFTVFSVIFMPPTLIASIYGMNFKIFPELEWAWGYAFALTLMLASSLGSIIYFKRKKWL